MQLFIHILTSIGSFHLLYYCYCYIFSAFKCFPFFSLKFLLARNLRWGLSHLLSPWTCKYLFSNIILLLTFVQYVEFSSSRSIFLSFCHEVAVLCRLHGGIPPIRSAFVKWVRFILWFSRMMGYTFWFCCQFTSKFKANSCFISCHHIITVVKFILKIGLVPSLSKFYVRIRHSSCCFQACSIWCK